VKLLRTLLALGVALAVQAGLGRLWPAAHRWVDVMMVPVVWYGIAGTQRSAMWVGCAAGLMQDGWLAVGAFGLNGFKKTLLGFALGGVGGRFDLNRPPGRFAAAALVTVADGLLDPLLRRLIDQQHDPLNLTELLVRAGSTALLVVLSFSTVDRFRRNRRLRNLA